MRAPPHLASWLLGGGALVGACRLAFCLQIAMRQLTVVITSAVCSCHERARPYWLSGYMNGDAASYHLGSSASGGRIQWSMTAYRSPGIPRRARFAVMRFCFCARLGSALGGLCFCFCDGDLGVWRCWRCWRASTMLPGDVWGVRPAKPIGRGHPRSHVVCGACASCVVLVWCLCGADCSGGAAQGSLVRLFGLPEHVHVMVMSL
jgi:hypothetical protein